MQNPESCSGFTNQLASKLAFILLATFYKTTLRLLNAVQHDVFGVGAVKRVDIRGMLAVCYLRL